MSGSEQTASAATRPTVATTLPAPPSGAGNPYAPAASRARLVGDEGIWFFIAGDLCLFTLLFLLFVTGRMDAPAEFERSRQTLHLDLGLINTLVLITSSYFMARAVVASRRRRRPALRRNLGIALGVGSVFALVKVFEYGSKFASGVSPVSDDFFMYYFALTGLHFLHYLGGMVAILVTLMRSRTAELGAAHTRWTESVGVYWHMVDLIWIFLFPILYLLRAT
jgi:nitric oxide reductase NorE protein